MHQIRLVHPVSVDIADGALREAEPSSLPAQTADVRERLTIVVGGHVDHGKSTVIGRLLADTGSLPEGKLDQVKALCERTSKPFEYAFLIDALREERSQGITIDSARIFFKTTSRDYLVIDAPGHIEFLKNMVTGAARAEAALLVIDAHEGVRENSKRHGYMMSMLGIRQVAVVVNKMDLVGYDEAAFRRLEAEYRAFLGNLEMQPTCFIPVCGRSGENIATLSDSMSWYAGPTVLQALDQFGAARGDVDKPFRMAVQDVYKFTANGDDRRIIAGTVDSGMAAIGSEVVFYPSGKKAAIKSFETFGRAWPVLTIGTGQAAGFTLTEQIFVTRGEIATLAHEHRPSVTTRLRVSVFWLGEQPLVKGKDYLLRLGTARATMRLEEVHRVIDASDLSSSTELNRVARNEVAECTVSLNRAIAADVAADIASTSRFVIVDDYEIRGGGIVREALPDEQEAIREKVLLRNYKWEPSSIPRQRRAARLAQRPALVLITGGPEADRKTVARDLEAILFEEGRAVYFLGIGNVLYGVDSDLPHDREHRHEHIRRVAEVANLMLDAGTILIVSALELSEEDVEIIRTTVDPGSIQTVWVGRAVTTGLSADLVVAPQEGEKAGVERIMGLLQDKGIIFRPC